MIKITIERVTTREYKETQRFVVTEKPTELRSRPEYGDRSEVAYERTYEAREVPKQSTERVTLLAQEIEDDKQFNLSEVILAINGIGNE